MHPLLLATLLPGCVDFGLQPIPDGLGGASGDSGSSSEKASSSTSDSSSSKTKSAGGKDE